MSKITGLAEAGGVVTNFLRLDLLSTFTLTFIKMKGRKKYNFHFQSFSALRIFFSHSLLLAS